MKLGLNPKKVNNYAFFCPVSRLHLTLARPVGFVDKTTPYIDNALKSKTLIQLDEEEHKEVGQDGKQVKQPTIPKNEAPKEEKTDETSGAKEEDKPAPKKGRGRGKSTTTTA